MKKTLISALMVGLLPTVALAASGTDPLADQRDKGYSVQEYAPQPQATPTASVSDAAPATSTSVFPLSYVVDSPESMNIYRVTVQVGAQSISRAFVVATDGKLYPAGAWVRKE